MRKETVDWEKAKCLYRQGYSYKEISKIMGVSVQTLKNNRLRQMADYINLLEHITTKPQTLESLSEKIDRSISTVKKEIKKLQKHGYGIVLQDNSVWLEKTAIAEDKTFHRKSTWRGNKIKFALLGDTHLCSKYQQLTLLNQAYDIIQKEGIKKVFHTGDILDGEGLYRGHMYEVFKIGVDEQVNYVVKNYPFREGVETEFITGNHDLVYFKKIGKDVGVAIAEKRPDLVYLGQFAAYVEIFDGVYLYLLHPDGGGAYAISYKVQKIIEGFSGGSKPNIMAVGHWHQSEYIFERNVHAIQTASFQGQTPFLKRKGLMPKLGFWIVEMSCEPGEIKSINIEFIPFYKEVVNDY